jgi:hypothetical protein
LSALTGIYHRLTCWYVHLESLDFVAVLGWEWSGVVPLQMFAPPTWLAGLGLEGILKTGPCDEYMEALELFLASVALRESALDRANAAAPLLSREWRCAGRKGGWVL